MDLPVAFSYLPTLGPGQGVPHASAVSAFPTPPPLSYYQWAIHDRHFSEASNGPGLDLDRLQYVNSIHPLIRTPRLTVFPLEQVSSDLEDYESSAPRLSFGMGD